MFLPRLEVGLVFFCEPECAILAQVFPYTSLHKLPLRRSLCWKLFRVFGGWRKSGDPAGEVVADAAKELTQTWQMRQKCFLSFAMRGADGILLDIRR